ncbi:MAG: type I glyceraldehyde-3-phosphate dehydrogenase [Desulfopila sp.]|nr:type I glyceraldehyde-3-phosphate dehydrogenase [Desulfopila sp.]
MSIRIGINGFGRIGRNICRAMKQDPLFSALEIVAINDLTDVETMAHLLKYDSVMGVYPGNVSSTENTLIVDHEAIAVSSHRRPEDIPWSHFNIDYVLECTGLFRDEENAQKHLDSGAAKVIISAPARGNIKTIVMGVNEDEYDTTRHHIVSNASCTTNCLAPLAQVILNSFGIISGLMTTVHAYTGDQRLLDYPHSDLRRARAAAMSMIPTKTGAAAAVALVIPELKNRFEGLAVRVPTSNVSLVDVVIETERRTDAREVNEILRNATNRYLHYSELPLVSSDYKGSPYSAIVDGLCTRVSGKSVKIMAWYDNEWGYSNRMLDLLLHMNSKRVI